MNADEKAEKYFRDKKVFPLLNSATHQIFSVEGKTGIWQVTYDKIKKTYSCNCKNVRLQWICSHIKSVNLWKTAKLVTQN
jgi:hypothetical protein